MAPVQMDTRELLTGKTTGMPPLTGLLPSSFAAWLNHRFSIPLLFQLVTVAPYSKTSTLSPVGNVAIIFPCSSRTDGCGPAVDGEIGTGRCGRSILDAVCQRWESACCNRIEAEQQNRQMLFIAGQIAGHVFSFRMIYFGF